MRGAQQQETTTGHTTQNKRVQKENLKGGTHVKHDENCDVEARRCDVADGAHHSGGGYVAHDEERPKSKVARENAS